MILLPNRKDKEKGSLVFKTILFCLHVHVIKLLIGFRQIDDSFYERNDVNNDDSKG